ncbi:unnamed protein product [Rotaria sp. Silwood2]|nr:unnamed protein product [Rotaria sp. Silwood2]CAF2949296.1 unnamed protein product [Rotaria sp. Silwood2]CAF3334842.1 unnamed protein product [Rotaria sp. Silwood2]CAF3407687.1 unnamed protein product [Rotaria sp. Silwood2]CAF4175316.1 unnamed protein product [Rotaria sp. Silwood2]
MAFRGSTIIPHRSDLGAYNLNTIYNLFGSYDQHKYGSHSGIASQGHYSGPVHYRSPRVHLFSPFDSSFRHYRW